MKPKTALQKQVAALSATLHPITATQEKWAYRHCFEHFAYRTNSGTMTCSDCGHVWQGEKAIFATLLQVANALTAELN